MKEIVLLSIVLIFISSSCKEKCYDTPNMKQIEFIDIPDYDFDGLIIRVYEQNSDFKNPIDSFGIKNRFRVETRGMIHKADLEKEIEKGYDYDVYIPKQGHFKVTKLKIEEEECSRSIFKSDYNYSIQGFFVNDFEYACSIIKIDGYYH